MRAVRRPSLSLRHLLILLTAIGLLPLAVLGVWSIQSSADHRLREQERTLLDLSRALSSAVDAELDGTVAILSGMVRSPELRAGDVRALYALARQTAQSQPDWLGVVLTDADGRLLFRTTAPFGAPGGAVMDPESVRQVLALRRPVVGRITRGTGGRAAVPVRIAVNDDGGRLYTLSAVIEPTHVLRVLERQRVPAGSIISILDGSGLVVARSLRQEALVAKRPNPALVDLMRRGGVENSDQLVARDGRRVATAYSSVSRYGWTVAAAAPPAASAANFALVGAGLAASLAVCIALASLLAGRIVRRIDGLAADATALGAGAPVAPVHSGIREIDRMAHALEAAARQRDAHERERSRLLASLEQAVVRQEDALAQAREAGRAKDEFLAVLGHELRNPLSPIVSSLDLMDMRDDAASHRERGIMRRQVSHLKRLVDDLLDVSRIVSGKLQVDPQPMNLADTVRHAVTAMAGQPIVLAAPDLVWIVGDDSRLTQVIGNLLSNAVRFGNGGTIRVELEVDTAPGHGTAVLSVNDEGAGIAADQLPHIFDAFFQAPQSLARRTGGLGLGLAIVRRIVELHEGRIGASSPGPGRGSRFEVRLPLAPQPGADAPGARAPAADAAAKPAPGAAAPRTDGTPPTDVGRRILLVDDNEDAAVTTAALLARLGHDTRIVHSAAAALDLIAGFPADAAILDIGLPDMDGYALAAALRAQAAATPGAAFRLIALTGYGQRADAARAMQAGFDVHLTKPASLDELSRALAPAAAQPD